MRLVASNRSGTLLAVGLALLLVCTAVSAYVFGSPKTTASNPLKAEVTVAAGEPMLVTMVGDSLDHGLYATTPSDGFHQLIVENWRQSGPVVDNPLNSLGGTAQRALQNPDVPRDQDLYVVELGTNDAAEMSHRAFRQHYGELLNRIKAASPDAALLCVGAWRPKEVAVRFDTIIKDLCEIRGGVFRSISDISENAEMKGPEGLSTFNGPSDAFHANNRGHLAIANRVLDAVVVKRQG
jgi:lysophospholipase L1-like esterase